MRKSINIIPKGKYIKVEFYKVLRMSFDRQDIKIPYSYNYFKKLDKACSANNSRANS